jgi:hypothetical protein
MLTINNELSLLSEAKLKYLGKKIIINASDKRPKIEAKITNVILAPTQPTERLYFFQSLRAFEAEGISIDSSSTKSHVKLKSWYPEEFAMKIHFVTDINSKQIASLYPKFICTENEFELLEC